MTYYYMGWIGDYSTQGGEKYASDYCFPNHAEASLALKAALSAFEGEADGEADAEADATLGSKANYYLGCLYYDKRQYDLAIGYWQNSKDAQFPTVWRNLALAEFNKLHEEDTALVHMEKAFALDTTDARILMGVRPALQAYG